MATNMSQIQWVSTGWSGGPGYTSFYTSSIDPTAVQDLADETHTFLNAIKGEFPTEITFTAPTTSRQFDSATGVLGGVVAIGTPPTSVTGTGNPAFGAPAGACVNWLTATPAAHKLVIGRTFLVPLGANVYQNDGTLVDADRSAIATAAATLVTNTSPLLVIWRRPVAGAGGSVAPVVAARVADRVAILKSRRS